MVAIDRRRFIATSAALWLGSPALAAIDRLTLAFIPQENPDKLVGDIEVITSWLSEKMGLPVAGFVTIDHAAAVEALRNGSADISFMGALPFVLAEAEIGAVPLLAEVYRGSPRHCSSTASSPATRSAGVRTRRLAAGSGVGGYSVVFDNNPTIVGSDIGSTAFNSGNIYPSTYDALGRRYAAAVKLRF